ncbi:MAG TPA: hypothetical protein VGC95_05560 [Chitinophagaceae bacterium]
MIPFWIFGLLTVVTIYLYFVSCPLESPVRKHVTRFKSWCRDRWSDNLFNIRNQVRNRM